MQLELTVTGKVEIQDINVGLDAESPKDSSTDLREGKSGTSEDWSHLRPAIGSNQCKCAKCGECFSAVSVFDKHQRIGKDGRTICIHPLDIKDRHGNPKPMVRNARGWWVSRLRELGTFDAEE